jgi:phage/plasmid-like protein (TIGR03299 family)
MNQTFTNYRDLMVERGLDFTVATTPTSVTTHGITRPVPDRFAIYRTDTGAVFPSSVGKRYRPIQNVDAFEWLNGLGGIQWENAGLYGSKVWIQATFPGLDFTVRNEPHKNRLLLVSSHDGSSSLIAGFTALRLACGNALRLAFREGLANMVRISHTANAVERMRSAEKILNLHRANMNEFRVIGEDLALRKLTVGNVRDWLRDEFLPVTTDENGKAANDTRKEAVRNQIADLFANGRGNRGESVWDLYNGVTEYVDSYRGNKNTTAETRWASATFGSGQEMKDRAWRMLTAAR